jgi:hypothetical protein
MPKTRRPQTDLQRELDRAIRQFGARTIGLVYSPPPTVMLWIVTAYGIDPLKMLSADEFTFAAIEAANYPIARGGGDTPVEAVRSMLRL